jgi:DNA-binding CsgD family transcriptional regulator
MPAQGEAGADRGPESRRNEADGASNFRTVAEASSPELESALSACEFPLVVWVSPTGMIRLANQGAADLVGVPLEKLVGKTILQLVSPRDAVERALAAVTSDEIEELAGKRQIWHPNGEASAVRVWTRAIELDGERGGVTLIIRGSDVGRLGRDLSVPWRNLVPIAVGIINRRWIIEAVSADIQDVIGRTPQEISGQRLLDIVHPDDVVRLTLPSGAPPTAATSRCHVRLIRPGNTWVQGCVLFAPWDDEGRRLSFAVVGPSRSDPFPAGRVAELELRLRRIAAEVRAAGVLDNFGEWLTPAEVPELGELTSRQWEILGRLLQGERVATIAAGLFVSPSTVRNHLATIFRKFGVHSQSALLERLRQPQGKIRGR